jgi:tRNA-2-methylthio-N6-dimethylallyladenosine synthase
MASLYIQTYGCQMNVYDSQRLVDAMADSHQMEQVDTPSQADLLIVNTCSIREKAQEKTFSELGRWRSFKENNPAVVIAVVGCVASQEGQAIIKRAPYVDIVLGPQTLHQLPKLYDKVKTHKKPCVDISFPEIEKFDALPSRKVDGPCALISIMEGCSKYCSYCIVPYTRGEEVSRPFDDILVEADQLVNQGIKEVTLLGQNVNDYRGMTPEGFEADLALLIHYLAAFDGIERIRFTTSHPTAFSQSLIDCYAEEPKLAAHLHLPVQSGSNRILSLMKRDYTVELFKEKIDAVRNKRPDISISSDFIVGFPGETESDFLETLTLIKTINFDRSFSFIYSPRPGTPAAELQDQVTLTEKKLRLNRLQQLLSDQSHKIARKMVGTKQPVLITNVRKNRPNELTGKTENNRIVHAFGHQRHIGHMRWMMIKAARPHFLDAELC